MNMLLTVFALSLTASLVLTPMVRFAALRWGLVDRPDGRRKMHGRITPAAGGLSILAAVAGSVAFVWWTFQPLREQIGEQEKYLFGLLGASAVACLVGVLDDLGYLRGRHKLLGQLLAVAIVMSCGVVVRSIGVFHTQIDLGLLAVPFTVFFLLGAINSLNFLDGMDGMLTSVGLIISLGMAAMAIYSGQWITACFAMALAGALLAFLWYNFPPASIFLGDSGSMVIGLVTGVVAIQSSLKGPATIALIAPTVALTCFAHHFLE